LPERLISFIKEETSWGKQKQSVS